MLETQMSALLLETNSYTVIAEEHNTETISDVLKVIVVDKKTKKEVDYSVKKKLYMEAMSIIMTKRKITDSLYTFEELDKILSIMPPDPEYWFFPLNNNKEYSKELTEALDIKKIVKIYEDEFNYAEYIQNKYIETTLRYEDTAKKRNIDVFSLIYSDNICLSIHATFFVYIKVLQSLEDLPTSKNLLIKDHKVILKNAIDNIKEDLYQHNLNNYAKQNIENIIRYSTMSDKKYYIFGVCQEVSTKCNQCPLSSYFPARNNENKTIKNCYVGQTPISWIFTDSIPVVKYQVALHMLIQLSLEALSRRILFLLTKR